MGRMKELAQKIQEEMAYSNTYHHNECGAEWQPTSLMEIEYEQMVSSLHMKYHRLTNEEIETIKTIANRII
jgi:hypothetical protein